MVGLRLVQRFEPGDQRRNAQTGGERATGVADKGQLIAPTGHIEQTRRPEGIGVQPKGFAQKVAELGIVIELVLTQQRDAAMPGWAARAS